MADNTLTPQSAAAEPMQGLARRLREAAIEVTEFPHPSQCEHLHDAAALMHEAANVIASIPSTRAPTESSEIASDGGIPPLTVDPSAKPPERDPHFGGHSYDASLLRELLAVIHGDGGHYVAEHGIEKACADAEAKWYAALAAANEAASLLQRYIAQDIAADKATGVTVLQDSGLHRDSVAALSRAQGRSA